MNSAAPEIPFLPLAIMGLGGIVSLVCFILIPQAPEMAATRR
jgi:hypothetical protein